MRQSRRKMQPDKVVSEHRRTWGARVRQELRTMGKTERWLGEQVYPNNPSSIFQVLNGHHGVSREAYEKVVSIVPSMRSFWKPPIFKERQGIGAPGPHKPHNYPKLGPRNVDGYGVQILDGRHLLATVDADASAVRVSVEGPLPPDEARRLGEALIVGAHYCEEMRRDEEEGPAVVSGDSASSWRPRSPS